MHTVSEMLAKVTDMPLVAFAGNKYPVHPYSANDARLVKVWFPNPIPPRIDHPDKATGSGEKVPDHNNPVYLAKLELAIVQRLAAEVAISLRLTAADGSAFEPGGGSSNEKWCRAVVADITAAMSEGEVGALADLVQRAQSKRLTFEDAVKN